MKILINNEEYTLSDEAIASLFEQLRKPLLSKLPGELRGTLENTNHPRGIPLLLGVLKDYGLGFYHALSVPRKLAVMSGCRWVIQQLEKKYGLVARLLRPAKRADPIDHVISMIWPIVEHQFPIFEKFFDNAELIFTAEQQNIVNIRLAYIGESGGQVASDGHKRVWENDGGETPEQEHSASLS